MLAGRYSYPSFYNTLYHAIVLLQDWESVLGAGH
jgi:hypothetical protein